MKSCSSCPSPRPPFSWATSALRPPPPVFSWRRPARRLERTRSSRHLKTSRFRRKLLRGRGNLLYRRLVVEGVGSRGRRWRSWTSRSSSNWRRRRRPLSNWSRLLGFRTSSSWVFSCQGCRCGGSCRRNSCSWESVYGRPHSPNHLKRIAPIS